MKFPPETWKWFGPPAHLCIGHRCLFHLATQVGDVVVSTVGDFRPYDYYPHAAAIGDGRTYETMVFKAIAGSSCDCGCGLPAFDLTEIDMKGYNNRASATEGHMKMCRKYASGET